MFPAISFLIGGGILGWILYDLQCSSGGDMFAFASRHHKKKHGGDDDEGGEYGGGHHHGGGGYGGHGGNPGNPHNKGGKHYVGTKGYYTKKGHHHCFKGSGPGCICTDPSKCHVTHHHSNLGFLPGGGGHDHDHDHDHDGHPGGGFGGNFPFGNDHHRGGFDRDDYRFRAHPFLPGYPAIGGIYPPPAPIEPYPYYPPAPYPYYPVHPRYHHPRYYGGGGRRFHAPIRRRR
jgi:hypothetical protein